MLAVSPLRIKNEGENAMDEGTAFAALPSSGNDDFPDLLDTIDFDDLFMGINDGDVLPDLEMDPEILAEFSSVTGHDEEYNSDMNVNTFESPGDRQNQLDDDIGCNNINDSMVKDEKEGAAASASASDLGFGSTSSLIQGDEIVSKRDEPSSKQADNSSSTTKGRKLSSSSSNSKNPPGKRKVKVDWTPELHRRFVQAVEQLGVDKAVPSRILELMGIDCLTRHNIASHLQKYRSHRKHLLAREAEAANWSQRRQMYGTAAVHGGGPGKRGVNPWIAPTMGFPPVTPAPPPHFRPLHVWGHPSVDQSFMQMWPKHLAPSPPPPHAWPSAHPPPSPPADPSFWHSHHPYVQVPPSPTPGFAPHLPPTRYPTPAPVQGMPPPPAGRYKIEPGLGVPPPMQAGQALPRPPSDIHPSKESVDAAIGDVLTKPWLPLPLGLKPPSIDSVMVELQRQGIPRVPPTNCA